MLKTTVYIDGFNLYFAMKRLRDKSLYWLDLHALSQKLAKQEDVTCKYFTARIGRRKEKRDRQNAYIEALETLGQVQITFGNYSTAKRTCPLCKERSLHNEEKKTDVNIALSIAEDAMSRQVDRVIILSTDTDLCPVLLFLKKNFPEIQREVAFPPSKERPNKEFRNLCTHKKFHQINAALLASCPLPKEITKTCGYVLREPAKWASQDSI